MENFFLEIHLPYGIMQCEGKWAIFNRKFRALSSSDLNEDRYCELLPDEEDLRWIEVKGDLPYRQIIEIFGEENVEYYSGGENEGQIKFAFFYKKSPLTSKADWIEYGKKIGWLSNLFWPEVGSSLSEKYIYENRSEFHVLNFK